MHWKKCVTKAGKTMLVEKRAVTRSGRNLPRSQNQSATPAAMAAYNEKMAARKLRLLMNANFDEHDYHMTLTYKGDPPTVEGARKELKNYLQRCSRHCQKNGLVLKYIVVTEWKNKRIHHHIVMSGPDAREAARLWKKGYGRFVYLDSSGDYKALADYLIKETKKSLRNGSVSQRWTRSRNLTVPETKEKILKRSPQLTDIPREYKHYALMDWQLVVNPVTGWLTQQAMYLRI